MRRIICDLMLAFGIIIVLPTAAPAATGATITISGNCQQETIVYTGLPHGNNPVQVLLNDHANGVDISTVGVHPTIIGPDGRLVIDYTAQGGTDLRDVDFYWTEGGVAKNFLQSVPTVVCPDAPPTTVITMTNTVTVTTIVHVTVPGPVTTVTAPTVTVTTPGVTTTTPATTVTGPTTTVVKNVTSPPLTTTVSVPTIVTKEIPGPLRIVIKRLVRNHIKWRMPRIKVKCKANEHASYTVVAAAHHRVVITPRCTPKL